ncbi:MAG: hypothetical protein K9K67_05650 [Bacteriovoracaceae bacterium]|nr:hypothetical protein [Bacteriovoracaceae bacterium]
MDLSIAFVKNDSQVLYQTFTEEKPGRPQIFDIEDLEGKEIHSILLPKHLLKEEEKANELTEKLNKTNKYAPIKTISEDFLTSELFDTMDLQTAENITKSTYSTWTLKNNLGLIENMFAQLSHLKGLWPNDRTAFFEELWHLLRSNLGATQMTIAYNHLKKAEKEGEKNQLIRVVVEGQSRPNPSENKELGEALFKNYEGKFANNFEVYSWDLEKGQVVFLASIKESPVIIMAQIFDLTPLQKATLNCLFEGLQ